MENLFKHPLKENEKIDKNHVVGDELQISHTPAEQGPSKPGLLGFLMDKSRTNTTQTRPSTVAPKIPLVSIPGQKRPVRTTRANALSYDEDLNSTEEVVKYSQITGLGKRWQT